jgi:tetratricopeptide (TPR) repeat protein
MSPQAFVWLSSGLDSDVTSGRLKLASAFYSEGDMARTELILRHTERQYNSYPLVHICHCYWKFHQPLTVEFEKVCNEQSLDCVKQITADCVIFTQQEVKCIPQELQYELFRSTKDDMLLHRGEREDYWMDWVVVDSLPFMYFLQYKIYRRLQRYQDKRHALCKLMRTIEEDKDIAHKETALNILGQCLEQEHRQKQALKCYLLSLRQRPRNNVANVHICRLLSGMLVGK